MEVRCGLAAVRMIHDNISAALEEQKLEDGWTLLVRSKAPEATATCASAKSGVDI